MDHLLHAFSLSRAKRFEIERKSYEGKVELIVVEPPPLGFTVPFTSMKHTAELEKLGYEQMVRTLHRHPVVDRPEDVGLAVAGEDPVTRVVPPAESSS
jgi:hypothetical protein